MKKGQVALDLSKSRFGEKILAAIRDGVPGWTMKSLEALDSGRLTVSHAIKLWNADEIRQAIERRIEAMGQEGEELAALKALLGDDGWGEANGGEAAGTTRESKMAREWMNVANPKKSMPRDALRKSSRVGSAVDILVGYGWEAPKLRKGAALGAAQFTNYLFSGHVFAVEPETQHWIHYKGARELAKSHESPTLNAALLMAELTRLHEQYEDR
jgi:hypothetical protein